MCNRKAEWSLSDEGKYNAGVLVCNRHLTAAIRDVTYRIDRINPHYDARLCEYRKRTTSLVDWLRQFVTIGRRWRVPTGV